MGADTLFGKHSETKNRMKGRNIFSWKVDRWLVRGNWGEASMDKVPPSGERKSNIEAADRPPRRPLTTIPVTGANIWEAWSENPCPPAICCFQHHPLRLFERGQFLIRAVSWKYSKIWFRSPRRSSWYQESFWDTMYCISQLFVIRPTCPSILTFLYICALSLSVSTQLPSLSALRNNSENKNMGKNKWRWYHSARHLSKRLYRKLKRYRYFYGEIGHIIG